MAKQTKATQPKTKGQTAYIVTKEFRDKDDFDKIHKVGADVSDLDEDRLAHLVSIGFVSAPYTEEVDEPDETPEQKATREAAELANQQNNPQ